MNYLFAECSLHPQRRELRRGSQLISVEPQVFDLLLYVVENRGRVVSKDELIATVWGGRIVSDSTLASRINAVRRAVGDTGAAQAIIRTVPRRGIRFVSTVTVQSDASETNPADVPGQAEHRLTPPAGDGTPREREMGIRSAGWVAFGGLAVAAVVILFQIAFSPPDPAAGVKAATDVSSDAAAVPPRLAGDAIVRNASIDAGTYESYLRVRAVLRGRQPGGGLEQAGDAMKVLEQVVERNPQFAPAWASLAGVYDRMPLYSPATLAGSADELRQLRGQYAARARDAAQRAVRLDPTLAEGHLSLSMIELSRRNMVQAFDSATKALSLDPTNTDVLAGYRNILLEVGRVEEALDVQQRIVALEPFVPRFKVNLATNLWLTRQDDEAIENLTSERSAASLVRLAMVRAARGEYEEAARALERAPPGAFPERAVEAAIRLLRAAPSSATTTDVPPLGALGFVYLHVGEPSRVVEFFEASIESGYLGIAPLWHDAYEPVRKTERFKALVERARLPEFWRARGWPKFCHPMGTSDFSCG